MRETMSGGRILTFKSVGQAFCIDASRLKRVSRALGLSQPVELDPDCVGVLDDGTRCLSLARLLGRPRWTIRSDHRILLVGGNDHPDIGIVVDQVLETVTLDDHEWMPLPSALTVSSTPYSGVVLHRGVLYLQISIERLIFSGSDLSVGEVSENPDDARLEGHAESVETEARHRSLVAFEASDILDLDRPLFFAVSIVQVAEVLDYEGVSPVPSAPSGVLGVLPWRRRAVTVVSLTSRLAGVQPKGVGNRMLVVRVGDEYLGFPTDGAIQVLSLPLACRSVTQLLPLEGTFLRGAFELADKILVLPNLEQSFLLPANRPNVA